MYTYIYIVIVVQAPSIAMCPGFCTTFHSLEGSKNQHVSHSLSLSTSTCTHIFTHTYIYIYIYMNVYICIYLCIYLCINSLNLDTQKSTYTQTETNPPFTIVVYPRDHNDSLSDRIVATGRWEGALGSCFCETLGVAMQANTMTFLDVGANIGYFTLWAAALGHKVIAVEPMKKNIAQLRASVCLNGPAFASNIQLYHTAVSAKPRDEGGCVVMTELGGDRESWGWRVRLQSPSCKAEPGTCRACVAPRRFVYEVWRESH